MKLIKRHFRAWLEGQPEHRPVGRRGEECGCPLAEYLLDKTGLPHTIWDDEYFVGRYHTDAKEMPRWAYYFITKVDDSGPPGSKITAGYCLRILDDWEKPS